VGIAKRLKFQRFCVWHSNCRDPTIMRFLSLFRRAVNRLMDAPALHEVEPAAEGLLAAGGDR
jgi:hypothetical protein